MNISVKKIAAIVPGVGRLIKKNEMLSSQLKDSRQRSVKLAREAVSLRLRLKNINGEKINVVFVCHRPVVWESLHSVYDALKSDKSFNVSIVAIPNKKELPKLGLNHEVYESEGAEDFWKEYGCINGYDYEKKEWFDLKELKPDYVFFQQPYNIMRCEAYKSWNVASYAKICYVPYAFDFIGGGILEETSPIDFMEDVSIYFTQNAIDNELISEILKRNECEAKTVISGFPRYDSIYDYQNTKSNSWSFSNDKQFKVMWTPRWCTNEGNCNFFNYKDKLIDYASKNKDVALLFRPHPQAFLNWIGTGEMSEREVNEYRDRYEKSDNMRIDTKNDYFDTIFESDCLISDTSSFIADYFMTGKPIIYCHSRDTFNRVSKEMSRGFYWVRNWKELETVLDSLKNEDDPLYETRKQILDSLMSISNNAGVFIRDYLKNECFD